MKKLNRAAIISWDWAMGKLYFWQIKARKRMGDLLVSLFAKLFIRMNRPLLEEELAEKIRKEVAKEVEETIKKTLRNHYLQKGWRP